MRRKTKNLLKTLCLFLLFTAAFYYYFLHDNKKLDEAKDNRRNPLPNEVVKQPSPDESFKKIGFQPPEKSENANKNDWPSGRNAIPFDWERRGPGDFQFPFLDHNKLGNYEKDSSEKRAGAGEYGVEVVLDKSLDQQVQDVISEFGFNLVASDRISLDRAPKDLRHQECKHWNYPAQFPPISVIIVFHNEGWSPLIRTVHNIINNTPKEYLHEIVMIDDGSQKAHLGAKMDEYIKRFNGIVKLYRNTRREGLIRARSIGAKKSSGDILVFLDAHCEAGPNWMPALITPIVNDYRACTVPLIDVIDGNKYTFTEQAGGDSDGLARGAWDWSFSWKRIPLTKKEKSRRKHLTEPYRSPAMAGGLFAIDRKFFFEIGLYDDGLEIWGGENFELSYKVWMCGGQLLFVPCSRIGHVYRLPGWRGNPPPSYVPANAVMRNYKRVIDTWWDEYAKYFYMRRPEVKSIDPGDLTEVRAIREKLHCRSFKWFMEEIAYDIPKRFPLVEPPSGAWGKVKNIGTNMCLDGRGGGSGSPIFLSDCNTGSEVKWWLTWHEDIRPGGVTPDTARKVCMDCVGRDNVVSFWECHQMQGNQLWKYVYDHKQLYHSVSDSCLEASKGDGKVFARACNHNNENQLWVWTSTNMTQLIAFNADLKRAAYVVDV